MEIIYDEELELSEDLVGILKKAAEICVLRENIDGDLCEVSLSVVDEDTIKELNGQYRDKDAVTDVLSFPQFDDLNDIDELAEDEEICLGDVVICDSVARRQAEEYGHSYEREFVYLFVHSVLHLLGYDHMEDDEKAEMRRLEEETMQEVGLVRE